MSHLKWVVILIEHGLDPGVEWVISRADERDVGVIRVTQNATLKTYVFRYFVQRGVESRPVFALVDELNVDAATMIRRV